jgi:hypothetical protein
LTPKVAYSDIFGCESSSSWTIVRTNSLFSCQLKKLWNILVSLERERERGREKNKILKVQCELVVPVDLVM